MGRLEGKVAVITGGGNGIGRATVLRFLAEGAQVVIADINESNSEETIAMATKAGHESNVRFIQTNVAEEEDVEAAIQCSIQSFGRLDCVFNNAGVGGAFGSITETTVEEWEYSTSVLLRGVFLGIKHGARVMKDQGEGGSIISTASVAGLGGGGGPHCYSACKAAVVNLTCSVAIELAPHRIRVNAVAPGVIMTELYHRGDPERGAERILKKQPWPEAGQGADIASVVLFLASDDSKFVVGETIRSDGGLVAAGPNLFGNKKDGSIYKVIGVDKGTTGEDIEIRKRL